MVKQIVTEEEDTRLLEAIKKGNADEQREEYEKQFPVKDYPGRFPVRTLVNNIMVKYNSSFKSATLDLKTLTKNKQLDSSIKYSIKNSSFESPCVNIEHDGRYSMVMPETFLAYTWCLTYFFVLQYENLIQKATSKESNFSISEEMMVRSSQLYDWAVGLRDNTNKDWTDSMPNPNPTSELIDSEALYCLKTNGLFTLVICFCLFHELGHVVHKDRCSTKEVEKEADNYALDCLLGNNSESEFVMTGMASIIGFGELLFIPKTFYGLRGSTHPETHRRLDNAMNKIADYYGSSYENEFKTMQIVILTHLFRVYGIDLPETPFTELDECIDFFESRIDDILGGK